ncbi:putative MATE family efflux protein [Lachnospiraceae bacterium PM6-15]|uniref:MATE family efflux transporter n=1 Tax=Ohessyouella blattaphilus TaxID=2949333 RepID=UPI003E27C0F0
MKFYKNFLPLFTVFVLQNIITLGVNLTDNIMLGAYNETSLAGVSAVNQIQFILQQLLTAMGDGVVMFGSQYWGKRQINPIKKIALIGVKAGIVLAITLLFITGLFPLQIMKIFTNDANIVAEGVDYLLIVRFSYLFFAITMLLLAMLRSVEIVKIGFILSIVALISNAFLNYLLIYGKFGFAEMGVQGAAIATLCGRIIECSILTLYLIKKRERLELKFKDFISYDKDLAKDYFKKVVPMLLIALIWGVNTALQTVVFGHMSATAIAANSIATVIFLLVKGGAQGAASATAIVIGKDIGVGDMEVVKKDSKMLQKFFVAVGIVGGLLLFFLRIPILEIYNLSPATKELANQFLIILSIVYVGMAYQMPTNEGIIKGGGSPEFVVKLNIISSWLIVIPLSFLMAFVFKTSPIIVIICLNSDQIFKVIPAYVKANHGKWIKVLTR